MVSFRLSLVIYSPALRIRHLHFKFLSIKNDKFRQHSGEKYTQAL
ncbi:hypothetical protein FP742_08165 [Vibrio parahaemolyticus]|uniref:Uncharacterized protein n=1 Tax=Vibrio parahaemolyticus serotype O3:K6 (strain RIMD 2210633) TaxID=223926 RepID=Q87L15_VIBPA|nr:hypothetical protein A6J30_25225 [Vibrio parahaemolyticus]BAC61065.1 hypothetical protein [Vibrio parahaemolyticus RIMD 2210633]AZV69734.1 hypothetical protein D0853_01585 [Vibrio parahaemolyticus]EGQ8305822.1 hypothetical protein [Vibrio parahaemolyticus]EGQ8455186.1 hypothetical protein [Vibrio parahaemolyticus]